MISNSHNKGWRSPLARRLALSIILVSSAITLLMTALQLYWVYQKDTGVLNHSLDQIQKVHVKSVTRSLWAANQKELRILLEGITQIPDIEFASVQEGGKLWHAAGKRAGSRVEQRQYSLTYESRDSKQEIGTLTVVANLDGLYQHVLEQALVILASNGLKTFLVAGFMLLIFHRQVNRHLCSITEHMQSLDITSESEPLALVDESFRQKNEFDILVDSINRMQSSAYSSHRDLRESKVNFHAIADFTIDWESWLDPNGVPVWVNPSVTRMTGYTPEECLAMKDYPLPMVADEAERAQLRDLLRRSATVENIEFQLREKNGGLRWMSISWQPVYGENDEDRGLRCSVRDIEHLKMVEQDLQHSVIDLKRADTANSALLKRAQQEKARLVALLSAMKLGILLEDTDKRVEYFNPEFRRIWLIPENTPLTGMASDEVMSHSSNNLSRPDHFSAHILKVLDTHQASETYEVEMADGRIVTQASYPVHDDTGTFIGRLWVYEDITRERQTAEQLIYLAERDSLTGLFNRRRFQEEMTRMIGDSARHEATGALLFFDLDEFKYINDTFGHRTGDSILIRIAGEVGSLVRKHEVLARLGGDEFAILVPDGTKQEASKLAERVVRAVSQIPFSIEGQNLRMTTSLGIALFPEHGSNVEELVAHADTAMYQAKDNGKNAWAVYRNDIGGSKEMLKRLTWHERICNALDHNLFELHFQGIYSASDLSLKHLEALVRMRNEDNPAQPIMPGHFIPHAEKTGKILDIDRWVVVESIKRLAQHQTVPAIAVNISGRSFDDPELPHFIAEQLRRFNVPPERLMVELTETAAVGDLHDAQRFIESLQQTGCLVCLDDFGSGFSSFSYLKHLEADILKIDGIFIRDLDNDHDNQIFVKSIVDVARGLNKITVAEFVENEQILTLLREFGVDLVQGYHLDTPTATHPALGSKPVEIGGTAQSSKRA